MRLGVPGRMWMDVFVGIGVGVGVFPGFHFNECMYRISYMYLISYIHTHICICM